jgi:hypothetical protein
MFRAKIESQSTLPTNPPTNLILPLLNTSHGQLRVPVLLNTIGDQ